MKIIVFGACGRMGKEVCRMANGGMGEAILHAAVDVSGADGAYTSLTVVPDGGEVIIDFSHHSAATDIMAYATEHGIPAVIATTGHSEDEMACIREAAKSIPVFLSANMSVGIAVLIKLAKEAVKMFPGADIEIVETHHNRKLDAPSGTALMIANAISEVRADASYVYGRAGQALRSQNEIGIHAVRMGNVVGEHEVIIGTDTQILRLSHQAQSRSLFAEGAIYAAAFLQGKPAGLYNMDSMTGK